MKEEKIIMKMRPSESRIELFFSISNLGLSEYRIEEELLRERDLLE